MGWEYTQSVEESGGSERREGERVEAPSDRLHASGNVTDLTGFIPCSWAGQYCDGHVPWSGRPMNRGRELQLCKYSKCWKGCCCDCLYGSCPKWRGDIEDFGCWSSAARDRCETG